jgi:hypothetical protein
MRPPCPGGNRRAFALTAGEISARRGNKRDLEAKVGGNKRGFHPSCSCNILSHKSLHGRLPSSILIFNPFIQIQRSLTPKKQKTVLLAPGYGRL